MEMQGGKRPPFRAMLTHLAASPEVSSRGLCVLHEAVTVPSVSYPQQQVLTVLSAQAPLTGESPEISHLPTSFLIDLPDKLRTVFVA